jgi:hypothetical protein
MKHTLVRLVALSPFSGPADRQDGPPARRRILAAGLPDRRGARPGRGQGGAYYHFLRAADLISRGSYTDAGAEFRLAIEVSPGTPTCARVRQFPDQTQNLSGPTSSWNAASAQSDNLEAHRMLAGICRFRRGRRSGPEVQELAGKAIAQYEEVLRRPGRRRVSSLGRLLRLQQPDRPSNT